MNIKRDADADRHTFRHHSSLLKTLRTIIHTLLTNILQIFADPLMLISFPQVIIYSSE